MFLKYKQNIKKTFILIYRLRSLLYPRRTGGGRWGGMSAQEI